MPSWFSLVSSFFFHPTATSVIYTLSLHDALPICPRTGSPPASPGPARTAASRRSGRPDRRDAAVRSEEHTSELQSRFDLVCRLLLEKKKISFQMSHRITRH